MAGCLIVVGVLRVNYSPKNIYSCIANEHEITCNNMCIAHQLERVKRKVKYMYTYVHKHRQNAHTCIYMYIETCIIEPVYIGLCVNDASVRFIQVAIDAYTQGCLNVLLGKNKKSNTLYIQHIHIYLLEVA